MAQTAFHTVLPVEQTEKKAFSTHHIFNSLQKPVVMLEMLHFVFRVGSSIDHAARLTYRHPKMFLTRVLEEQANKQKHKPQEVGEQWIFF